MQKEVGHEFLQIKHNIVYISEELDNTSQEEVTKLGKKYQQKLKQEQEQKLERVNTKIINIQKYTYYHEYDEYFNI